MLRLVFVLAALLFSLRAHADIVQFESVDLAVARADLVVRGEIVELISKKLDNGVVWHKAKAKVTEALKGTESKEVTFVVQESPFARRSNDWKNMRDEVLLLLDANNGTLPADCPFEADYQLRIRNEAWAVSLNVTKLERPLYSLEFKPLRDPAAFLEAVRAAKESTAGGSKSQFGYVADDDDSKFPTEILYPATDSVRKAAERHGAKLREFK